MKRKSEYYSDRIEAAKAWAPKAIGLTIKNNREYSSLIIKTKCGYKFTKPRKGAHCHVIIHALCCCFLNLFVEVHFAHTHTLCTCHIPDKFSGNPSHPIKEPGDYTVVKILRYDSIILVAPDGRIFELSKQNIEDNSEKLPYIMPIAIVDNTMLSHKHDNRRC